MLVLLVLFLAAAKEIMMVVPTESRGSTTAEVTKTLVVMAMATSAETTVSIFVAIVVIATESMMTSIVPAAV